DIPKGYQLSQYKYPVVSGGALNGVAITRVHIEEDTATSKHDRGAYTLVDYNRAGVPLMELVTEPVMHSATEAADFAKELQLLLRTLGVAAANMEKGELRVEANISLSDTPEKFGTKVEVKNLNSFRSVERAIEYELARMQALYEAGTPEKIVQETRGWDEHKQLTFSQRSKENANDYRYFPDPDLPKMHLHKAFALEKMKEEMPELPWQARERLGKKIENKELLELFVEDSRKRELLDNVVTKYPTLAASYIVSSIEADDITPELYSRIGQAIDMIGDGKITSTNGKKLLNFVIEEEGDPETIAKERGLLQESNEAALRPIISEIISSNEKIVADYKAGKEAALQALVGQVIKVTKGNANPGVVLHLLKEMLG
ncbi:MAG TPA: Asp-tRNA(Asn)/Glu-tRNA(Gln) amidotransferase subunit GatB, partial [Candidatus Paceibacterota bacterium]|nr:Asp-tRNA(Asn)/Glu-tRNA(Gln) amidotransferase subunit GatB [Candidatus Paceibacterota bacterium]